MISNDISLQNAVETLKMSLVKTLSDQPNVSDSHISLKTGVHRKDVRRLRAESAPGTAKKSFVPPVVLVMNTWSKSERFQLPDGSPRALSRQEFGELIRLSKVDLPRATVLSEMIAQKVLNDDGENLHLVSSVFVPNTSDAAIAAFEATILDHLRIAVDNTISAQQEAKAFDRAVRYTNLSDASVQKLEAHARTSAMKYLNDLNDMAYTLLQADDKEGANHTGRFVSGAFIAPVTGQTKQGKDTL